MIKSTVYPDINLTYNEWINYIYEQIKQSKTKAKTKASLTIFKPFIVKF